MIARDGSLRLCDATSSLRSCSRPPRACIYLVGIAGPMPHPSNGPLGTYYDASDPKGHHAAGLRSSSVAAAAPRIFDETGSLRELVLHAILSEEPGRLLELVLLPRLHCVELSARRAEHLDEILIRQVLLALTQVEPQRSELGRRLLELLLAAPGHHDSTATGLGTQDDGHRLRSWLVSVPHGSKE